MTLRIAATRAELYRLRGAVVAFIRKHPRCRSAQILRDDAVVKALSYMPSGKADFRWLDGILQAARRRNQIEALTGGYWQVLR